MFSKSNQNGDKRKVKDRNGEERKVKKFTEKCGLKFITPL